VAVALRTQEVAGAPDTAYLDRLKSFLETAYTEQDQQLEDLRHNRDLEDPPTLPEWLRIVDTTMQSTVVRDEIARVVATLTLRWPTCTAMPGEVTSDLGQEYTTELEHFLEELFKAASQRVPGQDAQMALTDACVEGGGWVKWVYDAERWEPVFQKGLDPDVDDEEVDAEKRRRGVPLARIHVDTATVYPLWEADHLAEVMEISHRQTYPTLKELDLDYSDDFGFGERLGRPLSEEEGQKYPETLELIEHWSDRYVSYMVHAGKHSKLVRQIEHGYPGVPYFFAPGILHNYMNDRKVGYSVASNKLDMTRFQSFLATAMLNMAVMQAAMPIARKEAVPAESMEGQDRDPAKAPSYDIPYASVVTMGTEDDMKQVEHPGIPNGLQEMYGMVSGWLASASMSAKLGPIGAGDLAGAGFAIQSYLAEAKLQLHPFVYNIEQCLMQETYFVMELIQTKVKETIWVRRSLAPGAVATPEAQWIGMGPDDMQQAVGIRWTLDPEPATSKIVESRWVIELVNAGLLSEDQAMAHLGFNPDEVREGKAMDRIRKEPWYTKAVDDRLTRRLQRGDLLKVAADAASQSGLLPGMDPMLASMSQQARNGGMPGGFGPPMGQPPMVAPGAPIMPDQGALTAAPGGGAAIPQNGSPYGVIGAGAGIGPGVVLPTAGIQAGVQTLGI
jgi:hypothetical protein